MIFCVDLDVKTPEVLEFSGEPLRNDMECEGTDDPMDLEDYDRRLFLNERDARAFLIRYTTAYKSLDNAKTCRSRDLPAILLKRRYIVLALMGIKLETFRHYKKEWNVGDLFNFHDQTFFLTCRLKSIEWTKEYDGCWRYEYEVIGA